MGDEVSFRRTEKHHLDGRASRLLNLDLQLQQDGHDIRTRDIDDQRYHALSFLY